MPTPIGEIHDRLTAAGYQVASVRQHRDGRLEVLCPDEPSERALEAQALAEQERVRPPRMGPREAMLTMLLDPDHVVARRIVTDERDRLRAASVGVVG